MMTSNFSAGSAPRARDANASEIKSAKTKRSFITDVLYLKGLFARRKFEADPFAAFPVQKRLGDRRHPAHPIVFEIRLVYTHDAVARLVPLPLANRHVRAEANDV